MRPRLTDWLDSTPRKSASPNADGLGYLLQSLRSGAPGQWSQNLTELSRHFTSAVYLALNTQATQAAGSTFEAYERTTDPDVPHGKNELPWHDPIHELFENPNPTDSWSDLAYQSTQQLGLTGIDLTWVYPSKENPEEIYNIPSCTAWPMPPTSQMPFGAYRVTPYLCNSYGYPTPGLSAGALVPAQFVIRVKNHHPFIKTDGYATLSAMSLHVDTLEGIDKSRFATQQQGCEQAMGFAPSKDDWNPDATELTRFRSQIQAIYAGPANAGKLLIPPTAGSFFKLSTAPAEMAWTEGFSQILDFVLAAYQTPKAVAGLQEGMSYATLYSSLRAFTLLAMGPLLNKFGDGWTKHLIWPWVGRAFGLRINPREFTDPQLEENAIANDDKVGLRTVAERRRQRNLDHIDEPWTKERAWLGKQMPEGGKVAEPEGSPTQEDDPNVDRNRPNKSNGHVRENLLAALEKGKTNGHLKPIKD